MRHILARELEHRHGRSSRLRSLRNIELPSRREVQRTLEPAAHDVPGLDTSLGQFGHALRGLSGRELRVLAEGDRQLPQRLHLRPSLRERSRRGGHGLIEVSESLDADPEASNDRAAGHHRGVADTVHVGAVLLGQLGEFPERTRGLRL